MFSGNQVAQKGFMQGAMKRGFVLNGRDILHGLAEKLEKW
jgi:hypothetical protein